MDIPPYNPTGDAPLTVEHIREFQSKLPKHLRHRHIDFLLAQLDEARRALTYIHETTVVVIEHFGATSTQRNLMDDLKRIRIEAELVLKEGK